jgi:hypothetical protein
MKVQVEAHVLYRKDYHGEDEFKIAMFEMESCGYITVGVQTFEVEIPDDFDPRQQQIQILEKEKRRIEAEFSLRCTQIQEQINKLYALEAT